MDRYLCSKLAIEHFSGKQHTLEFEEFAGNRFEFRTYEIEVAVFGDNFNEPPVVKSVRVRLTDEEYLLLLQWQLQNPKKGFTECDMFDAAFSVQFQAENQIFGDDEIGTYAIFLTEIRRDADIILRNNS